MDMGADIPAMKRQGKKTSYPVRTASSGLAIPIPSSPRTASDATMPADSSSAPALSAATSMMPAWKAATSLGMIGSALHGTDGRVVIREFDKPGQFQPHSRLLFDPVGDVGNETAQHFRGAGYDLGWLFHLGRIRKGGNHFQRVWDSLGRLGRFFLTLTHRRFLILGVMIHSYLLP